MTERTRMRVSVIVGAARSTGQPITALMDALADIKPEAAPLFDAIGALFRCRDHNEALEEGRFERIRETVTQLEEVYEQSAEYANDLEQYDREFYREEVQ